MKFEYLDTFSLTEIYLHKGCNDIIRATKLIYERNKYWTSDGLIIDATTVPMVKWSDIVNKDLIVNGHKGKLRYCLTTKDVTKYYFCFYWYDNSHRDGIKCCWQKLENKWNKEKKIFKKFADRY